MREIKFRGKSIDNGEWVYGWAFGNNAKSIIEIDKEYPNEYGVEAYYTSVVIPETVGQYVEILDAYEGDILCTEERDEYGHIRAWWYAEVKYNDEAGRIMIYDVTPDEDNWWEVDDFDFDFIAGNVFDNPDLLEVE